MATSRLFFFAARSAAASLATAPPPPPPAAAQSTSTPTSSSSSPSRPAATKTLAQTHTYTHATHEFKVYVCFRFFAIALILFTFAASKFSAFKHALDNFPHIASFPPNLLFVLVLFLGRSDVKLYTRDFSRAAIFISPVIYVYIFILKMFLLYLTD